MARATLYTDGSGLGGYGIYGVSDHGRIECGGRCEYRDSVACELYAILEGIRTCLNQWGENIDRILVHSDSQQALKLTKNSFRNKLSPREDLRELQKHFQALSKQVRVDIRWVPGHQTGNSTEAYLNRKVDQIASRHNRAA
jgi:ribonuclease HI